jgi:uncharacterized protein with PIN domain
MNETTGVCKECQGILRKTTFRQAWAKRGIKDSTAPAASNDCYQCEKCNMIYNITHVQASVVDLDQTSAKRKDFGFSHGRAQEAR